MKYYLILTIFICFSCKKELQTLTPETTKKDTLEVTKIVQEIDTIYEYRETSMKMVVRKGDVILDERVYLLSKETEYDNKGDLKQTNEYKEAGSYGMNWSRYYPDGMLKEKGQLVEVSGGFLKGGEHLFYSKDGVLIKKVIYTNDGNDSYHQLLVYAKLIEYYNDQQIKSIRFYEGGYDFSIDLSESQIDDKDGYYDEHSVGVWKFYDKNGKLIKTEKH